MEITRDGPEGSSMYQKGTISARLSGSVTEELFALVCQRRIAFFGVLAPIQPERRMVFRPGNLDRELSSTVFSFEKRTSL